MNNLLNKFWAWYERHYTLNVTISSGLFVLQLIHLTWLALHVIAFKLTGHSLWNPGSLWQNIIIFVDYTEIPALISTSLIYINEIRKVRVKNKTGLVYFCFVYSAGAYFLDNR